MPRPSSSDELELQLLPTAEDAAQSATDPVLVAVGRHDSIGEERQSNIIFDETGGALNSLVPHRDDRK